MSDITKRHHETHSQNKPTMLTCSALP